MGVGVSGCQGVGGIVLPVTLSPMHDAHTNEEPPVAEEPVAEPTAEA
jgi:hypothetical protein